MKIVRSNPVAIADLLKGAIEHDKACETARLGVVRHISQALYYAWLAGITLNKLKALVPPGDWLAWLEFNVLRPSGMRYRTAALYMKIDMDNAQLRSGNSQRVADALPDFEQVRRLKFETIRRYAIALVPEKLAGRAGNRKSGRAFRLIVRESERIKRLHISGRQLIDFDEAREVTAELYQFLRWIHGDSNFNPWD